MISQITEEIKSFCFFQLGLSDGSMGSTMNNAYGGGGSSGGLSELAGGYGVSQQGQSTDAGASGLLGDIFGTFNPMTGYAPPKQVWLSPAQGKGLEVQGTFSRKNRQVVMEVTLANRALQPMTDFDIRLNKNR